MKILNDGPQDLSPVAVQPGDPLLGKAGQTLLNFAIFALLIVLFARSPIISSLWIDEAVSVWILKASWSEIFDRAITFQGQSPLYFILLKGWYALAQSELGQNEIALRSLSVIASVGTLWLISALARELIDPAAGKLAILLTLSNREFIVASLQARPYSLGIFSATASVYCLVCWIKRGTSQWLWAHTLAAISTFYFHYLFALVGVVHLALIWQYRKQIVWRRYLQASCIAAICAIPGFVHLFLWRTRANIALFGKPPTASSLLASFLPIETALCALLASAVTILCSTLPRPALTGNSTRIALVWVGAGNVLLYALAQITQGGIFLRRYLSWRIGGVTLLLLLLFLSWRSHMSRLIFLGTFLLLIFAIEFPRQWAIEDWRQAALVVAQKPELPIWLYGGLAESEHLSPAASGPFRSYLAAPLSVYGIPEERITVMPGNPLNDLVAAYVETKLSPMEHAAMQSGFFLVLLNEPITLQGQGKIEPLQKTELFLKNKGILCHPYPPYRDSPPPVASNSTVEIRFCRTKAL